MFTITKQFTFEAAHKLPHHDGKCARLHGHSWVGELVLEGEDLNTHGPKQGMLADFGDVKKAAATLLEDQLDHHYLNETTGLENPTSEEIARWIYNQLKPSIPQLVEVVIRETCTAKCVYRP